ncbi:hypothetical protein DESC_290108 [Desulfosarcina cetonica]|nr:hypothetical protein DESC_290108 [Desulfosarcina cetonica]
MVGCFFVDFCASIESMTKSCAENGAQRPSNGKTDGPTDNFTHPSHTGYLQYMLDGFGKSGLPRSIKPQGCQPSLKRYGFFFQYPRNTLNYSYFICNINSCWQA